MVHTEFMNIKQTTANKFSAVSQLLQPATSKYSNRKKGRVRLRGKCSHDI